MNSSRSGEGVHCGRRKKDRPFRGVTNACHHARSSLKASGSVITSCGLRALAPVSIILLRNVRLAGTTLAAKLSVPMRDRSSCFLHWVRAAQRRSAWWMPSSLSGGSRASSAVESRSIPRYSRHVVGPSRFSSARGTPRWLQREVRVWRWLVHSFDPGAPATKKSSR